MSTHPLSDPAPLPERPASGREQVSLVVSLTAKPNPRPTDGISTVLNRTFDQS